MAIIVTRIEKLICKNDGHEWEREPKRGKKPLYCDDHMPAKPVSGPKTLHCEAGDHDWQREPKRGKAPRDCPDHQPVKTPPSVRVPAETLSALQEDAKAVTEAKKLATAREIAERLTMRLAELSRKTDREVIDTSKADYLPTKRK